MAMVETDTATKVVNAAKTSAALNHLKNNRIEYLVILLFSHILGFTDVLFTKASGVCG